MNATRRLLLGAPLLLAAVTLAPGPVWALDERAPRLQCSTQTVRTTTTTVNPDGTTTVSEETKEETVCRAIWGT